MENEVIALEALNRVMDDASSMTISKGKTVLLEFKSVRAAGDFFELMRVIGGFTKED